jgi:hypothetical protein
MERTMLSSKVAAVCSAGGALALPVRAALASASCRRAVSRSISACWFVTISAVEVSVVGVSAVQEFEDWLAVPRGAMVLVLSSGWGSGVPRLLGNYWSRVRFLVPFRVKAMPQNSVRSWI